MKMLSGLAAVAIALACAAETPAAENLVKNYSFEIGEDEFDYEGWANCDGDGRSFSITNAAAHGHRALFCERPRDCVLQDVHLPTNGTYELTMKVMAFPGTVKTNGQPTGGLGIWTELRYTPKKGEKGVCLGDRVFATCAPDATPKWETLTLKPIVVPEGAVDGKGHLRMRIGLNNCSGQGLVDEVIVRKVKSEEL